MLETEGKAIQTILENGERIEIPSPFFWKRWLGRMEVLTLKEPSAATCLEAIKMRLSMGFTDDEIERMTIDEALEFKATHGLTVAKILALVIIHGSSTTMSVDRLAKLLLRHYSWSWIMQQMQLVTLSGLEDFTITIGLTQAMRLTKPNDPSHDKSRRQRS